MYLSAVQAPLLMFWIACMWSWCFHFIYHVFCYSMLSPNPWYSFHYWSCFSIQSGTPFEVWCHSPPQQFKSTGCWLRSQWCVPTSKVEMWRPANQNTSSPNMEVLPGWFHKGMPTNWWVRLGYNIWWNQCECLGKKLGNEVPTNHGRMYPKRDTAKEKKLALVI